MTRKTVPFTFDNSFERDGRAPAGPRPPQRKTLSLDEIETIKRDAHAAGLRAAEQGQTKRVADALLVIAQKIDTLGGALDAAVMPAQADAAALAYVIGLKLARVLLGTQPAEEIKALIAQCITEQKAEPHLVLRVNDMLHDHVKEAAQKAGEARAFGGRIHVIGEPEIVAGDCRIEWADGGLERNLKGALGQIEAVIRNYVLRSSGNPEALPAAAEVLGGHDAPAAEPQDEQITMEGF